MHTMSYPEVLDLTGRVQLGDGNPYPSACGGYADVYRATCGSRDVAVKVIRATGGKDIQTLEKKLRREMNVWSTIEHKNVLPFLGFCRSIGNRIPLSSYTWCFVSPWMAHGEARSYIESHPDVNRLQIGFGVANGLYYLHLNGIVHGDIKGANILINHLGTPLLCDFGLALYTESPTTTTVDGELRGSIRWMAHELIMQATQHDEEQELTRGTPQSDTWSFASTLLELLTLKLPYHSLTNDIHVLTAIMARKLPFLPPCTSMSPGRAGLKVRSRSSPPAPSEPDYFAEVYKWPGVWELCKSCWRFEPHRRPTMGTVVRKLGEIRRKGPYDHDRRPKRALSPHPEEDSVARKSPRPAAKELPDTGRVYSPLRMPNAASLDSSELRTRSLRTPTTRSGGLHTPEEFVRKPRPSRLSFSSNSSNCDLLSVSSSGHSSPRVHPYNSPYHSSAFKRLPHRRSPSSGSHTPAVQTLSTSAPASLGPFRVSSAIPHHIHTQPEMSYPTAGLGIASYPTPSVHPPNPLHAFPDQRLETQPYNYDPQHTSGYSTSGAQYPEGFSNDSYSGQNPTQDIRRQSTLSAYSLSQTSSLSHHMTSQLVAPDSHHSHYPHTSTRESTFSSVSSGPFPHSPSPPNHFYEPAVHTVDAHNSIFNVGYYSSNPSSSSQPFAQGTEDISSDTLALLEQQCFALSQGSSPDHSPTRATTTSLPHGMHSNPLYRRVSDTLGIRTEFLDKHTDLDNFIAQTPSPIDESDEIGDGFPLAASERYEDATSAPRRGASAAMSERSTIHHHLESRSNSRAFPDTHTRSGSIRPLFAHEFTESPGIRGRNIPPDNTPSLRPSLTVLTPIERNRELFDEEAVEIEEDGEVDDAEPPPDSYMTNAADDFDDETDVEPDGDNEDIFNTIIPLGHDFSDEGSECSSLEGVGLFGGRVEEQYWRHEECPRGNRNGHPHFYTASGGSTPRQEHILLPPTPMGLGIKLTAT